MVGTSVSDRSQERHSVVLDRSGVSNSNAFHHRTPTPSNGSTTGSPLFPLTGPLRAPSAFAAVTPSPASGSPCAFTSSSSCLVAITPSTSVAVETVLAGQDGEKLCGCGRGGAANGIRGSVAEGLSSLAARCIGGCEPLT